MRTFTRTLCATLAAAAAPLALAATASARPVQDPPPRTEIIAGEAASANWIVQLRFVKGGQTFGCTGEAISADWVLTARHCIDGISSMNVYYSNSTRNPGAPIAADRVSAAPSGDIALVHLSRSKPLSGYGVVANSYDPQVGDRGVVAGYGWRANRAPADRLYKASVNVIGESTDAYRGPAVHIEGVSGASNHGDSGGPLVVNGQIVAVCSTGDEADPGANPNASSNYANLSGVRDWISQVTGV